MSRTHDVSEADLRALAEGDYAALGEAEALVVRYAEAMTAVPVDVPDTLFAELRARFSPEQIVELTAAIAWENYRARFNHALLMESEGYSEGAFCPLPARPPALAPAGEGPAPP